jgi:hypothetical protein
MIGGSATNALERMAFERRWSSILTSVDLNSEQHPAVSAQALFTMGLDAATVQRLLRHSSISVTTGTYVEVIERVQPDAVFRDKLAIEAAPCPMILTEQIIKGRQRGFGSASLMPGKATLTCGAHDLRRARGAPEGIRTPNLLILSDRPHESGIVRYRIAPQRITAGAIHVRPVESGLIWGRLCQESGDYNAERSNHG